MPLPNVSGKILAKVIEYCKKHVDARSKEGEPKGSAEDDLKAWDTDYVKVLDQSMLFELILVRGLLLSHETRSGAAAAGLLTSLAAQAANYLNIKGLLDLTCLTVANMIKGAHPGEAVLEVLLTAVDASDVLGGPAGKTPEEIRKHFNIEVRACCAALSASAAADNA